MILYLFVRGRNWCLCKMGILRGRFYALSSAGKMEDWTGLYISLSLLGAFFIILPYTVLHSAAKHPLMYCPGWFGEVR